MSEYWPMVPAIIVFLFIIGAAIWKNGYWCAERDEARRQLRQAQSQESKP